jgi:5-formyltetrahydrofolate cyclo-ligase
MQLSLTDKAAARAFFIEKRRALDKAYIEKASAMICENALCEILARKAVNVLMFSPIGNEPRIDILAEELLNRNIAVFYPISRKTDLRLDFRKVTSLSQLTAGAYGIKEPSDDLPAFENTSNTVCIVPALAFDKSGMRLGYGKGYYDRFLSTFSGTSIGVSLSLFLTGSIPTDNYDIPVDMIATEQGVIITHEADER